MARCGEVPSGGINRMMVLACEEVVQPEAASILVPYITS